MKYCDHTKGIDNCPICGNLKSAFPKLPVDKIVIWRPCRICKDKVEYTPQTATPEHDVTCNTCGYMVLFSVYINGKQANELWNKIAAI